MRETDPLYDLVVNQGADYDEAVDFLAEQL